MLLDNGDLQCMVNYRVEDYPGLPSVNPVASGTITSRNYPLNYKNNELDVWQFQDLLLGDYVTNKLQTHRKESS